MGCFHVVFYGFRACVDEIALEAFVDGTFIVTKKMELVSHELLVQKPNFSKRFNIKKLFTIRSPC